ncbi:MAG TPA: pre-toxin TG domain-containing protein, partial [Myxococcaceae bacterium]|nr:pre-toxin TG domain-containing protein [Myxococcaceae bacterium]
KSRVEFARLYLAPGVAPPCPSEAAVAVEPGAVAAGKQVSPPRDEKDWEAVERKLAEYDAWGQRLLEEQVAPPHRVAPGYLVTESPFREQAIRALINATHQWAWTHTDDPDFWRRSPAEVALYLLASRAWLATALEGSHYAPVHLDYNPDFDPEVYTLEELLLELGVGLVPGAGEVDDLRAALTGVSLTGKHLTNGERVVVGAAVLVPLVGGALLSKGPEAVERVALLTGRGVEEVRVLARVASYLSPEEAR